MVVVSLWRFAASPDHSLGRVYLILAICVVDDAGDIAQAVAGLKGGRQRYAPRHQLNALGLRSTPCRPAASFPASVADGRPPRGWSRVGADVRGYELLVKSRVEGLVRAHQA